MLSVWPVSLTFLCDSRSKVATRSNSALEKGVSLSDLLKKQVVDSDGQVLFRIQRVFEVHQFDVFLNHFKLRLIPQIQTGGRPKVAICDHKIPIDFACGQDDDTSP